jgi:hypothetical protein
LRLNVHQLVEEDPAADLDLVLAIGRVRIQGAGLGVHGAYSYFAKTLISRVRSTVPPTPR